MLGLCAVALEQEDSLACFSSALSKRIVKLISSMSIPRITHFYEPIIKPYSTESEKDRFWKAAVLFESYLSRCLFFLCVYVFLLPCWLLALVLSSTTRIKHLLQGKKMKRQQWQRPAYCRIVLNSLFLAGLLSLLLNDSVTKCHPFSFQESS